MDLGDTRPDLRYLSKILRCVVPTLLSYLAVKVTALQILSFWLSFQKQLSPMDIVDT